MVAFNAEFDARVIAQTCAVHGLPGGTTVRWTCAQQLLSPLWQRERVSLASACQDDLLVAPGTHRAATDARAMVEALRVVARRELVVFAAFSVEGYTR